MWSWGWRLNKTIRRMNTLRKKTQKVFKPHGLCDLSKDIDCEPGLSPQVTSAGTLILSFHPSELWELKLYWLEVIIKLMSEPLYHVVVVKPTSGIWCLLSQVHWGGLQRMVQIELRMADSGTRVWQRPKRPSQNSVTICQYASKHTHLLWNFSPCLKDFS